MGLAELLRVLAFVSVVFGVFGLAGAIVVQRVLFGKRLMIRGRELPLNLRRAVLALATVGLACVTWGFIEPYRLEVSMVSVPTPKLSGIAQPLRIVHLSDIHSDAGVRLERTIPEVVAGLKPDLICFTGDAFNSSSGAPVFREMMTKLVRIAPTFMVKGNWDTRPRRRLREFEGLGATEVNGNAVRTEIRGTGVWISGLAVNNTKALPSALANATPDELSIFLFHYPDLILDVAGRGPDLYLAGHTHGGQIALPFFGALTTRSRFDKRFEAGLYREQDTYLYVSRGIGMGAGLPRVRFLAPPEVAVIDLVPSPAGI